MDEDLEVEVDKMPKCSNTTLNRLKRPAQRLKLDAAYRRALAVWHLRGRFAWAVKFAMEHGRPEILLCFGLAPGDDLLCTTVLRELASRGRRNIWMMSNYPELFAGNADVAQVVPVNHSFRDYATLLGSKSYLLEYAAYDPEKDMSMPPNRHIIAELCMRADIRGQFALRPYFYPTSVEKEMSASTSGMIAIQSSGLAAKWPMRNKQWIPERFQEVVNRLKNLFRFVQLGSANDPQLTGAIDLRGKTSIRETAAVLANCRLFTGNAGFLMHLARAVECPAVIVYGGREAPWQTGYSCNVNLYSAVHCAPCWLWNRCDYGISCMEMITVDDVINGITILSQKPRENLTVDRVKI